MVLSYDEFKFWVGETIGYCQTIENDVKWIYAAMRKGDMFENFDKIAKMTLGAVIDELNKLDNLDNDNFLTFEDYKTLRSITKERNYLAHNIFTEFIYEDDFEESEQYQKACSRLMNFHNRIERLYKSVENAKLNAIEIYRKNN